MNIGFVRDKINLLLNSGFDEKENGIAFIAKVRMFNQVCIIGIITLVILGSSALSKNYLIIGLYDFIFAAFLTFIIYYLRVSHKYNVLSTLSVIITGVLFFYLYVTGGVDNTGHLWYYTFPLFSFFIIDSKKASYAAIILLILALIYFFFQDNFPRLVKYSPNLILRFVPSYLVVFIFSYIFEKTRERTYKIVSDKNKELSNTVDRLEKNEKELKKLHEELEQKVVERTSELKDTNKQLVSEIELKNKAMKVAESAVKMKTEFLAQVSHEIRTPVNSILSYTQLLKTETLDKIPEELKFCFDMINNGGHRLIRTVDLILNMSEVQTGTYEAKKENSDIIKDIIKPLVGEFQSAAKTKGLELSFQNELEGEESIFEIDVYTVTQIIANLIDNAIKYTDKGSIKIIAYKSVEGLYSVEIQDTGIGISKKFQETLFEPFTQEEQGYTRKFEGNGLGMALVKEYCNINKIKISVQSEKGNGSTFKLIFPKKKIFENKEPISEQVSINKIKTADVK